MRPIVGIFLGGRSFMHYFRLRPVLMSATQLARQLHPHPLEACGTHTHIHLCDWQSHLSNNFITQSINGTNCNHYNNSSNQIDNYNNNNNRHAWVAHSTQTICQTKRTTTTTTARTLTSRKFAHECSVKCTRPAAKAQCEACESTTRSFRNATHSHSHLHSTHSFARTYTCGKKAFVSVSWFCWCMDIVHV